MLLDFFTDFIVDVKVSENTLVMAGCDQRLDPSAIQTGMMARVVAKVSLEDWSIRAIAVLLKDVNDIDTPTDDPEMARDITGMLTDVSEPDEEGGYVLSVEVGDTEPEEIYMEAGVEPTIEIPGEDPLVVPIDVLKELTGCVEVSITAESNGSSHRIASDVRLEAAAEEVSGFVEEIIDDAGRTVTARLDTGYIITVIINSPRMSIDTNYFLEAIGLNTCEGPEYFLAVEVEITSS